MRVTDLRHLVCPTCAVGLAEDGTRERDPGPTIEGGQVACPACHHHYPVEGGVARFVAKENYASSFGFQWHQHARTQYDSFSGVPVSERRFFGVTGWNRNLSGQLILEVGCGAGRFTEQAALTGGFVVSVDYSRAVETNYRLNGSRPNVLIAQADVYRLPFRQSYFDKVFCFGVLQHTPDPERAFHTLVALLKPGGSLVVDVYKSTFTSRFLGLKYYLRPLVSSLESRRLYGLSRTWVDIMWPISEVLAAVPQVGTRLSARLLVPRYDHLGVPRNLLREWAYLDAFDMLSPTYDQPQSLQTVRRWFEEAGLVACQVRFGPNGIVGQGRRPFD